MERRTFAEFLFATSSAAALLLATSANPASASVGCSTNIVGNTGSPTVNSGSIACIEVTGNAVSLTNTSTGKIGPSTTPATPVIISSTASLSGGVLNAGTITLNTTSVGFAAGMFIDGGVAGSVSNAGTISVIGTVATGASVTGLFIDGTVRGGVVNSGTITSSVHVNTASCACAYGIKVVNGLLLGGITNNGTIAASAVSSGGGGDADAFGISVQTSLFTQPLINTGTITATANAATDFADAVGVNLDVSIFSGGFTNSGAISASATSGTADANATGVALEASNFIGNVVNSGTISAMASGPTEANATGLSVFGGSVFQGTIANSGMISAQATTSGAGSASAVGILFGTDTLFNGSFVNSGTVSAIATATDTGASTAIGIEQNLFIYGGGSNTLSFANSGMVSASATSVGNDADATGVDLFSYNGATLSFANSGTITAQATAATSQAAANGVELAYESGTVIALSSSVGIFNNSGIISASASVTGVADTSARATGLSFNGGTVVGSIINSGTIIAAATIFGTTTAGDDATAGASGIGIFAQTLIGDITNSGKISASAVSTATAAVGCNCAVANGIAINMSTFIGTLANSGTITTSASQASVRGCACAVGLSAFVSTMTGSLSNSGTITATATGAFGCARGVEIVSQQMIGNVGNSGQITASFAGPGTGLATGVLVSVGTFTGTVTNSGTIAATLTGHGTATGIKVFDLTAGSLTIANSGTISAVANTAGAHAIGIDLSCLNAIPITINQTGGLISAATAIAFSANGDTLNASGGKIAGNLVGPTSGTLPTINVAAGAGGTFTFAGMTTNIGVINANSGTFLLSTFANSGGTTVGSVVNTVTFTQAAGGTIGLGVLPTVNSSVTASGALTLAGPLVVYEGVAGWNPGTTYTYANALVGDTLTGAFSSVGSNSPLFTASAATVGNSETVTLGLLPLGSVPGLSGNDRSVLGALETLLANPNTPASVVNTLGQIYTLNSTSQVGALATSLSGEQNTQNFQFSESAWSQFSSMLMDRLFGDGGEGTTTGVASFTKGQGLQFAQADIPQVAQATDAGGRAGGVPAGRQPSKWGVWARGYGSWASAPLTASSASYDESGAGVILGGDAQITNNLVGGFAFNIGTDTVSGGSHNNINTYQGAFYGKYNVDPHIYVAGLAGFGWQDYDSRRFIMAPISANATANYSGQGYRFYGESGYAFHLAGPLPETSVTPYLGLGYLHSHIDGFTEAGGGGAALSVGAVDANSFTTSLGARASTVFRIGQMALKPEVRAAWEHEWLDQSTNVQSSFASSPGSVFTVTGAGFGRDSFVGGAGISTTLAGFGVNDPRFASTQLFIDYDVKTTGGYVANVVSGGLRAKF